MKLLLDTHALIWFLNGDPQLSNNARLAIENPANHIFISHAAVWEISIKNSLGKLDLTRPFYELNQQLYDNAIDYLPLVFDHFVSVNRLPLHHRDPFDRLMIAQAQTDGLTLVTKDSLFQPYSVVLLW